MCVLCVCVCVCVRERERVHDMSSDQVHATYIYSNQPHFLSVGVISLYAHVCLHVCDCKQNRMTWKNLHQPHGILPSQSQNHGSIFSASDAEWLDPWRCSCWCCHAIHDLPSTATRRVKWCTNDTARYKTWNGVEGQTLVACTSTWSWSQNLHTHLFMTACLRQSALASASDSVVGKKAGSSQLLDKIATFKLWKTRQVTGSGVCEGSGNAWSEHGGETVPPCRRENGTEWESSFSKAMLSMTKHSYRTHWWPLHATLCTHHKISPKLNSVQILQKSLTGCIKVL